MKKPGKNKEQEGGRSKISWEEAIANTKRHSDKMYGRIDQKAELKKKSLNYLYRLWKGMQDVSL